MSEHASNPLPDSTETAPNSDSPIRIYVPPRLLVLTGVCGLTGASLGLMRGSRAEGMRFLAENAHRAPTTLQGWYMYKKTKNYRMMWGGLKAGGRDALRLGAVGACFALVEDGIGRIGESRGSAIGEAREAGAGLITAGLFSVMYRLPWVNARRAVVLGGLVGGIMSMLRRGQKRLIAAKEIER